MLDGVGRWIWVRHWLGTPGCRTARLLGSGFSLLSRNRRNCSQYGHDVFGGEQSDASCFVRHGGLRWWWGSSPWCRSGVLRAALSCPLGPWCAKLASNVLWRAVRLGQQKGRLIRAAHRGSFLPCRRLSQPDARLAIMMKRSPTEGRRKRVGRMAQSEGQCQLNGTAPWLVLLWKAGTGLQLLAGFR